MKYRLQRLSPNIFETLFLISAQWTMQSASAQVDLIDSSVNLLYSPSLNTWPPSVCPSTDVYLHFYSEFTLCSFHEHRLCQICSLMVNKAMIRPYDGPKFWNPAGGKSLCFPPPRPSVKLNDYFVVVATNEECFIVHCSEASGSSQLITTTGIS